MAIASEAIGAGAGVLTAVIGLAVVATFVSNNANTANVIGSGGQAFSNMISAAEAPVTGGGGFGGGMGMMGGGYGVYP